MRGKKPESTAAAKHPFRAKLAAAPCGDADETPHFVIDPELIRRRQVGGHRLAAAEALRLFALQKHRRQFGQALVHRQQAACERLVAAVVKRAERQRLADRKRPDGGAAQAAQIRRRAEARRELVGAAGIVVRSAGGQGDVRFQKPYGGRDVWPFKTAQAFKVGERAVVAEVAANGELKLERSS